MSTSTLILAPYRGITPVQVGRTPRLYLSIEVRLRGIAKQNCLYSLVTEMYIIHWVEGGNMSYFHKRAGRSVEPVGPRRSSHRFFLLLAIALLTPLALLYAQTVYKGSKGSSTKSAASTTLSNVYVTL